MFEELKAILKNEFKIDESLIQPEAEFIKDLKLNSLEIADFVVFCEDHFETEVEEEDIHSIITIQDLCNYIEARK